jgi:predicted AAA+ superfamily ATPase
MRFYFLFGLTLTFLAPTQARYLAIVDGMAQRRGVELLTEELHGRALAWATQRGGRSVRVAKRYLRFPSMTYFYDGSLL